LGISLFSADFLDELSRSAKGNPRLRQHANVHRSYGEACQRFFNAIEPGSYIRPHRHLDERKSEMLIAVRGEMALITFDDKGTVINALRFGQGHSSRQLAVGAEVAADTWHTVVALVPSCVLLEVKEGPFDPVRLKEFAAWAPAENSPGAREYLLELVIRVEACLG
jgi:cupin fold WbuC family metalloprotein